MKLLLTKHGWLCSRVKEHPCHCAINLHCNNVIFTGPFLIVVKRANGTSSLTQFAWLTCWPRGFKLRPLVAPQDFQLLRSLPLPSLFPSVSFLQHVAQCPLLPQLAHNFSFAGHTLSDAKCPDLPHAWHLCVPCPVGFSFPPDKSLYSR